MKSKQIKSMVKSARKAARRGNLLVASEEMCFAILGALSAAVSNEADAIKGISYLLGVELDKVLIDCCHINQDLYAAVANGDASAATIGGNFHLIAFVHIAWLLEKREVGEEFCALALAPEVMPLSTPFWQEYARAIQALLQRKAYTRAELRLRGQEKYWGVYLILIEQFTNDGDIQTIIEDARSMFRRRNVDAQIRDDNYRTEGSASWPVKWDYRLESLLRYCKLSGA